MKFLLITIHIEHSLWAVPLGAAMIASSVKAALPDDIEPHLLNLYLGQPRHEMIHQILLADASVISFSIALWNRNESIELARILKEKDSSVILVAGGPEATADEPGLKAEGVFDEVIAGEGETAVVTCLRGILAGETGQFVGPSSLSQLASLPSPYLDKTLEVREYPGILWELSRGCTFQCHFCFESMGLPGVRRFPFSRIKNELELFAHSGVTRIFILDPTFNYNRDEAKRLLRLIISTAPAIHYSIEARAEYIDEELAGLFSAINCSLQIGLQSAHPMVLKTVNRTIQPENFRSKILLLHEAGVTYGFDLIYGLPRDTFNGFLASLDFALEMMPNHLDIFPLSVLPGTRLIETAEGLGLVFDRENPYLVTSTVNFSGDDMIKAGKIADAINLVYNRGRAVPWLPILLENLDMAASNFFISMSSSLPADHETIPLREIPFVVGNLVAGLYAEDENQVRDLVRDIILWFFVESEVAMMNDIEEHHGLHVRTASWIAQYIYNPLIVLDNLEQGVTDLEILAGIVPRINGKVIVFSRDGVLTAEILTEAEDEILMSFADKTHGIGIPEKYSAEVKSLQERGILLGGSG